MTELLVLFAHENERDIHLPAAFWILAGLSLLAVVLALMPADALHRLRLVAAGARKAILLIVAAACLIAGLGFAWVASTTDDDIVTSEAEQQRLQVLREPPMPAAPR